VPTYYLAIHLVIMHCASLATAFDISHSELEIGIQVTHALGSAGGEGMLTPIFYVCDRQMGKMTHNAAS